MTELGTPTSVQEVDAGVTHVNVAGIRYLPLAPVGDLRSAVREYLDMRPRCDTLRYLADEASVVLCREDCVRVLDAASGASTDKRLSAEARDTFARICHVLRGAVPLNGRARAMTAN